MGKNLAIGFLSLTFLMPSAAWAVRDYGIRPAEFFGDVYLTLKYGEVTLSDDVPDNGSDIRNFGFVFGNSINPNLAVEFEFTQTVSVDDDYLGSGVDAEVDTLGIFLVGKTTGDFYVRGKIGYTRVAQEFGDDSGFFTSSGLSGEKNVYGVAYGIGAGIKTDGFGYFELEYTVFPTRDDVSIDTGTFLGEVDLDVEMDMVSLNYVLAFD